MGVADKVLDFRIPIDVEFQGWILLFATLTAVFFFCLPCYCAGLSWAPARRMAAWISQRLPVFYFFMLIFNCMWMFLVVTWLPDWEPADYVKYLIEGLGWTVGRLLKFMTSIVMIVAFCFVVAFKDRIALLMGLDHRTMFKCKFRDFICCCAPTRFRAIEFTVWKVEDLASADIFSANNVFLEIYFGYNEALKSRVHNNAGSSCIFKETIQLNFDPGDDDETMHVFIKNQKVVGDSELGRMELKGDKIKQLEIDSVEHIKRVHNDPSKRWSPDVFCTATLVPRGKIYFRITPADTEDERTTYADLTTC